MRFLILPPGRAAEIRALKLKHSNHCILDAALRVTEHIQRLWDHYNIPDFHRLASTRSLQRGLRSFRWFRLMGLRNRLKRLEEGRTQRQRPEELNLVEGSLWAVCYYSMVPRGADLDSWHFLERSSCFCQSELPVFAILQETPRTGHGCVWLG